MRTHAQIISDAGGYQAMAGRLSIGKERVRFWERRGNIPPEWWPEISRHRIATLTELTAAVAERKRGEGVEQPAEARA